jgi:hypothetical protein
VAIGMMSVAITLLGIILAYIWRSNGKLQRSMMETLKAVMEGQKSMMEGQKSMMEGQKSMMEALLRIEEGQRQGFKYLADLIVLEGEKNREMFRTKA